MGALTEQEIFDCMATSLRSAINLCDQLATKPKRGLIYDAFRKELALVEGCCRQASTWREDTRWLPIGLMMEEAHKRAGDWIRGTKDPVTGIRLAIPEGQKHPLFVKLGENLKALLLMVEGLKTKATKRVGMILPHMPNPGRNVSQIGFSRSKGGLIIPDGVAVQ